jgi:hypothetical protein
LAGEVQVEMQGAGVKAVLFGKAFQQADLQRRPVHRDERHAYQRHRPFGGVGCRPRSGARALDELHGMGFNGGGHNGSFAG